MHHLRLYEEFGSSLINYQILIKVPKLDCKFPVGPWETSVYMVVVVIDAGVDVDNLGLIQDLVQDIDLDAEVIASIRDGKFVSKWLREPIPWLEKEILTSLKKCAEDRTRLIDLVSGIHMDLWWDLRDFIYSQECFEEEKCIPKFKEYLSITHKNSLDSKSIVFPGSGVSKKFKF